MTNKTNMQRALPGDLVVVRASELEAIRALLASLETSSDDTGCSDGLSVIDGKPLEDLVAAMKLLKTKPLIDSLRMLEPASERLDRLMLVVPPEVTTEEARRQVLAASALVTEGLGDADDPDQEAFLGEVTAMGLYAGTSVEDLGIGAWDSPSPEAVRAAKGGGPAEPLGDTVYLVIQEGGATGELYIHATDSDEEAEAFRFSCRHDGSFRTSPVIKIPRYLSNESFYEAVEELLRAAALDLGFPEGEAPAQDGDAAEHDDSNERGERHVG
jgi:hypothetical protein